jgi:hypothetical protein
MARYILFLELIELLIENLRGIRGYKLMPVPVELLPVLVAFGVIWILYKARHTIT